MIKMNYKYLNTGMKIISSYILIKTIKVFNNIIWIYFKMITKSIAALCLLCFAARLKADDSQSDLKCPEIWNGTDVFFLSKNCAEYFQCNHGVPILMHCSYGLHWDQSAKHCTFPDQISPPCTGCVIETGVYVCGGNGHDIISHMVVANGQDECASNCASTKGCNTWRFRISGSFCSLHSNPPCKVFDWEKRFIIFLVPKLVVMRSIR